MFKTIIAAAAAVAIGATALASTSAFANKVMVSTQSNAKGNVSDSTPTPTLQQLVGNHPTIANPLKSPGALTIVPSCKSYVCLHP